MHESRAHMQSSLSAHAYIHVNYQYTSPTNTTVYSLSVGDPNLMMQFMLVQPGYSTHRL